MLAGWLPEGVPVLAAGFLVLLSFFTSLLTAAFGIGGGLVMLSCMTYIVPVTALIPVHGAVQFGSNAGRAILQRKYIAWPELFAFMAGGAIGAWTGAHLVIQMPESWLELILGGFVLAVTWLKPPRIASLGLPLFALSGAITTFLTMFFGATGPLNAAAFEKTFPNRQTMVATLASLMTAQHVLKILAFGAAGFSFSGWLPLIGLMILVGFAGTRVGLLVLGRIREETFRLSLKIIMTVIALDMLRRGLTGF
jgi:uncharacterized membrane protein YfcA